VAKVKQTNGWFKFLVVLAVLVAYGAFALYKFGVQDGLAVTALTWSFFVFATPIADAGFLIGFPLRLLLGIRMLSSQIGVWIVAFLMNVLAIGIDPGLYSKTALLDLFHKILTSPWPLWSILILSAVGTLVTTKFNDDAIDIASSRNKKQLLGKRKHALISNISVFGAAVVLYAIVLATTHTSINVF
jgi:hypothetical protein